MAVKDVEAAVKAASSAGKVGIVGYCWGGIVTWLAAHKIPGLAAAVPYYGGGILDNTELAPKVPLMGHFGEQGPAHPGRRGEEAGAEVPAAPDLHLCGRPRLQLRPPRLVQRPGGQAGALAHAGVLQEARRLEV